MKDAEIKKEAEAQLNSFDFHTPDFTKNEQRFLDQWLCKYIELELGRPPSRKIEEHILDMLEGRLPIGTIGMETYLKWKAAKAAEEKPFFKDRYEDLKLTLGAVSGDMSKLKDRASANGSALLASVLSTDISRTVSHWTEELFEGTATIYDKAADVVYLATHEGGGLHRLFDGGHSVGDMWEAVRNASPDDTLAQEVAGYVDAFLKDVSTVNGLPFTTISKDTYDTVSSALSSSLGIPKSWTADALSFNMAELFSTSLGVIALALNWNTADRERFADYATSLGIAAGFSANPLLGVVALVSLAKALQGQKGRVAYTELLKGVAQGGVGTGLLLTASTV
jgi:hypothetical protein